LRTQHDNLFVDPCLLAAKSGQCSGSLVWGDTMLVYDKAETLPPSVP